MLSRDVESVLLLFVPPAADSEGAAIGGVRAPFHRVQCRAARAAELIAPDELPLLPVEDHTFTGVRLWRKNSEAVYAYRDSEVRDRRGSGTIPNWEAVAGMEGQFLDHAPHVAQVSLDLVKKIFHRFHLAAARVLLRGRACNDTTIAHGRENCLVIVDAEAFRMGLELVTANASTSPA
jgi:hypothetical protein